MIYDLQKASILKRISAFLLDFILICILATGFGALLSVIVDFDGSYNYVVENGERFEELNIDPTTLTKEEFEALPEETRQFIDDYSIAFSSCVSKAFLMISLGLFLSHLVLEFIVPLCLKNGQTVGKKVFSVGVMQITGVKLNNIALFVRAILGKYAVETMVPLSIVLVFFFVKTSPLLIVLFVALYVLQIVLFFATKRYALIHDAMSSAVVVDMQTQMIFNSNEDMLAYKEELHRQEAEKAEYK